MIMGLQNMLASVQQFGFLPLQSSELKKDGDIL